MPVNKHCLIWNINMDKLSFKAVTKTFPETKRGILSIISTIYNSLEIPTLATFLKSNKIIQEIQKDKNDWDETIPHQLLAQWNTWKQNINSITKISLNTQLGFHKENNNNVELYVFSDASTIAYGAVAYLKCISIDKNKPVCSFVMSKSTLAPMYQCNAASSRLRRTSQISNFRSA